MNREEIKSVIESILFTMGDLVEPSRIAAALELPEKEVTAVLSELADHRDRRSLADVHAG